MTDNEWRITPMGHTSNASPNSANFVTIEQQEDRKRLWLVAIACSLFGLLSLACFIVWEACAK